MATIRKIDMTKGSILKAVLLFAIPICIGDMLQQLYNTVDGKEEHLIRPGVGEGFEEEIIEACSCIRAGKPESDVLPLSESIAIIRLMDRVRRQIGVKYPFEREDV